MVAPAGSLARVVVLRRHRGDQAVEPRLAGKLRVERGGDDVPLADGDDPAVVDAMRALFASWKATAVGGADANSALAAITAADGTVRGDVDLIVADLRLADGKSGIDAIARLRDALGAGTPALIVSGDTSAAAQAEVRSAGIRLLLKPVVAAALTLATS